MVVIVFICPLYLQAFKERFCHGVVPAISLAAHTLFDRAVLLEDVGEPVAGILGPPVRMEYKFLGNGIRPYRHPPGRHDSCLLYTSDAADDLTRVDLGGRRIIKKKKIQ